MPTVTGYATDYITFSRASNATVTDSNGYIKWAAHNLLTNSESFDAATWTKSAATVSANVAATTAPNSTSTADKIAEDATTASHRVQQGFNATIGATYTLSVFAKAAERSWLQILTNSFSSGNQAANFNLSNGTVGTGATGANLTKTITSIGSGWYLCTITWTPDATGSNVYFYILDSDAATGASYAGVSGNGIYLWGAHLYRSDLGGMVANTSAYPYYNPTTPKNLLGYTEAFDNAAWSKTASTVTANTIVAPNGLQTGDTYTADGTSSPHRMEQIASSGYQKFFSFYAKAGTNNFVQVFFGGDAAPWANFNLSTGAVGSTGSNQTAAIADAGNGWYRCSVYTSSSTATNVAIAIVSSASAARNETNTLTTSIYLWGAQLSDSASLDTYSPVYGAAVTSSAYYAPRLDYDPSTLAAKGLLVEEQRTNVVTWSNDFDNIIWAKTNATITTGIADPFGGTTAAILTATGAAILQQAPTVTSGVALAGSIWIRRRTGTGQISLRVGDATAIPITITSTWQRISASATPTSTSGRLAVILSVTGDEVDIWGAQLEAGSFATSYIPTTSATVTRSADVAQVSTQAFPYSQTEGTLVAQFSMFSATGAATRAITIASDGTSANRIYLNVSTTGVPNYLVVSSTATQASINATEITSNSINRFAAAYKTDDFASCLNGGTVGTDTLGSSPTGVFRLDLGNFVGGNQINGHIRQITYLPRRLTNAELQSRTT